VLGDAVAQAALVRKAGRSGTFNATHRTSSATLPMKGLLADAKGLHDLRDPPPRREHRVGLTQLAHNLFRRMPCPFHLLESPGRDRRPTGTLIVGGSGFGGQVSRGHWSGSFTMKTPDDTNEQLNKHCNCKGRYHKNNGICYSRKQHAKMQRFIKAH